MNHESLLTLEVLRPAHGGTAIAFDEDGRPIFVSHAVPGEVVRARVTQQRGGVRFAEAVEILTPSPHRRPHFWSQAGPGGIGGAELGHVMESYQRRWKGAVIADQLRRVGGRATWEAARELWGEEQPLVKPATGDACPALHWRTRIEVVASRRNRLAMRPEHSHELIELEQMPLAIAGISELPIFGRTPLQRLWQPGQRVRVVAPNADGVRILVGESVYDGQGQPCSSRVNWSVEWRGLLARFEVAASGFWQIHRSAPADLVAEVMAAADPMPGQRVLELYSGAGLFSYFLAHGIASEGRLVTLEGAPGAVRDAKANLARVPAGTEVRRGSVTAGSIARAAGRLDRRPDLVVLDPPRAGAGKPVCTALAKLAPRTIVLVSCDPAAGARDLASLLAAGYKLTSLRALDLFPQTHHVEIVAGLRRG